MIIFSQTKPSTSTNPTDYVHKRPNQSEEWGFKSFVSNYIYSNNVTLSECKKKTWSLCFCQGNVSQKSYRTVSNKILLRPFPCIDVICDSKDSQFVSILKLKMFLTLQMLPNISQQLSRPMKCHKSCSFWFKSSMSSYFWKLDYCELLKVGSVDDNNNRSN